MTASIIKDRLTIALKQIKKSINSPVYFLKKKKGTPGSHSDSLMIRVPNFNPLRGCMPAESLGTQLPLVCLCAKSTEIRGPRVRSEPGSSLSLLTLRERRPRWAGGACVHDVSGWWLSGECVSHPKDDLEVAEPRLRSLPIECRIYPFLKREGKRRCIWFMDWFHCTIM